MNNINPNNINPKNNEQITEIENNGFNEKLHRIENKNSFKKELEHLINKYSLENDSDTPDFILAEYLFDCLENFNKTTTKRNNWFK